MLPQSESSDVELQELERRLRADARQFGAMAPAPDVVSAIVNEHARRRHRVQARRRTRMIAAGCLVLVGVSWLCSTYRPFEFATLLTGQSSPAGTSEKQFGDPVDQHGSSDGESGVDGHDLHWLGNGEASFASTGGLASDPSVAIGFPSEAPVPAWIVTIGADGQPVTVLGVYVPARVKTVQLEDLSPPVRRAARMILGIDEPEIGLDPI